MDKKLLKKYVNLDYFEIPEKGFKSKFLAFKYHSTYIKLTPMLSELFICNKTSPYDKILLTNSIVGNYVYMKDSVVEKLYRNEFSDEELKDLRKSINRLQTYFISIVMFPERHMTVFGDFQKIPRIITDFIYKLKFEHINFVNLIGSYFIEPIWIDNDRMCTTKIDSRFSLKDYHTIKITLEEFNTEFNKYIPSSASIYSKKYPVFVRGNKLAEHFERVFYICPHCKNFLQLYSEYCCIKCKDCGSAFEFTENYEINLTNNFKNLDEAKNFQYSYLSSLKQTESKLFTYKDITFSENEMVTKNTIDLIIYQTKLYFEYYGGKIDLSFDDIEDIFLSYDNTLHIKIKNIKDYYIFRGLKNENLYIIVDLVDIYKKNKPAEIKQPTETTESSKIIEETDNTDLI